MIRINPSINDVAQNDPFWKDVQQAESQRYTKGFEVLALASGRVAVLGPLHSLHAICDTFAEAIEASFSIPSTEVERVRLVRARSVRNQEQELSELLGL